MIIKYYINEYNDLVKEKFGNWMFGDKPTMDNKDLCLPNNDVTNFSFDGIKLTLVHEEICFFKLNIEIYLSKYIAKFNNSKNEYNLFKYKVYYLNNEYISEYFERDRDNVIKNFYPKWSENKTLWIPKLYRNREFLRLDKENSNHEREKFLINGFDISAIEKNKYTLHLKKPDSNIEISKKSILLTTYKIKKL